MAGLKSGCICKGIKLIRLVRAIENGASSFEQIKAVTGIGTGPCQGKRCGEKVRELLGQDQCD
jgi:bacterioferritin-associated ferredoxin